MAIVKCDICRWKLIEKLWIEKKLRGTLAVEVVLMKSGGVGDPMSSRAPSKVT